MGPTALTLFGGTLAVSVAFAVIFIAREHAADLRHDRARRDAVPVIEVEKVVVQTEVVERPVDRVVFRPVLQYVEVPGPVRRISVPAQVQTKTVVKTKTVEREKIVERIKVVSQPLEPEREETDVYRLYNSAGELLYVGIGQHTERWLSHRASKEWWPEVASHQTLRYPYRGQALAVEHAAIRHEKPLHNKARGGLRDAGWPHGDLQPKRVEAILPAALLSASVTPS